MSADCPQDRSCVQQTCQDPCPGTCGINARCLVVNHNPICSCLSGYTGDPFDRCIIEESKKLFHNVIFLIHYAYICSLYSNISTSFVEHIEKPSGDPCIPSPCGPFAICRVVEEHPVCSCITNYLGRPPYCRPECTSNSECPGNLACIREKCMDPCPGSCGSHASCTVIKHVPVCTCDEGYAGDPFSACSIIPSKNLFQFICYSLFFRLQNINSSILSSSTTCGISNSMRSIPLRDECTL